MTLLSPLTTERLVLRDVEPDDLDAVWAYRCLPDVSRWLGGSLGHDSFLQKFLEPAEGRTQLVALDGGTIVGDLMVDVRNAWSQAEVAEQAEGTTAVLGWVLAPAAQGRGLATEAVSELLRHCFEDLAVRRVTAVCFASNEPSWRLMERVGMRREAHHVRSALHRDLGWQDELVYAALADVA